MISWKQDKFHANKAGALSVNYHKIYREKYMLMKYFPNPSCTLLKMVELLYILSFSYNNSNKQSWKNRVSALPGRPDRKHSQTR